jgi:hypothetical protein
MENRLIGTLNGEANPAALASDLQSLELALAIDTFHPDTTPEFFVAPFTQCLVFEDNVGPVMFVRGTSALRVDLCFTDNADKEKNKVAILEGIEVLKKKAKANGFTELIGCSNSLELMTFFKNQGFEFVAGEMRICL